MLTLPQFQAFGGESAGIRSDPVAILLVLIGLFISHAVSFRSNYIGRGEYLRTSVSAQMNAPYGRLIVLHLTIIVGGLAIATTGAPSAAVLILVLLKTALDLGLHLAEHREDAGAGPRVLAPRRAGRVTPGLGVPEPVDAGRPRPSLRSPRPGRCVHHAARRQGRSGPRDRSTCRPTTR